MLRHSLAVFGALVTSILAVSAGCGGGDRAEGEPTAQPPEIRQFAGEYPIRVVCTTGQVADMLRNVGGEHVAVTAMMGPGVDPHLYRESPSDIERLSSADAIFYNGVHLEGRMADLFEKLAERQPTFAVTHALVAAKDAATAQAARVRRLLRSPRVALSDDVGRLREVRDHRAVRIRSGASRRLHPQRRGLQEAAD